MPRGQTRKVKIPPGFHEPLRALFDEVAPVAVRLGLHVFLVGGAVRDLVEGRPFSGEWDVVVFGGGDNGATVLAGQISRARGRGEPVSFPRFGTSLVCGPRSDLEFAQAHLRSNLADLSTDPLTSDAMSRDFTLNALYVEIGGPASAADGSSNAVTVLDPCGRGLKDLRAGRLRTPIPARLTFEDDPLRIFRAARLRANVFVKSGATLDIRQGYSLARLCAGQAPDRGQAAQRRSRCPVSWSWSANGATGAASQR